MTTSVETGIFNLNAVVLGKEFALHQFDQQVDYLDVQLLCAIGKLATWRAYIDISHFSEHRIQSPGKRNHPHTQPEGRVRRTNDVAAGAASADGEQHVASVPM